MNPANQAVSGGIGGFLAFFLLACALWLLMRNMNSRLRNVKYREELDAERQSVEADQDVISRPPRRGEGSTQRSGRGERAGGSDVEAADVDGDDLDRRSEHPDSTPLSRS